MDDDLIICEEPSGHKQSTTDPTSFTWTNDHLLIVNESDLVLCSSDPGADNKTPQIRYEIKHLLPSSNSNSANSNATYQPILMHQNHPANTATLSTGAKMKKVPLTQLVQIVQQQPTQHQQQIKQQPPTPLQQQPQPPSQNYVHKDPLDDDDAVDTAAVTPMVVGEQNRFVCPRCGKDYSQSKNMRRHYRLECGQEPKYPCPYCQLRFKRNNQLKNHIISRHCATSSSVTGIQSLTTSAVKLSDDTVDGDTTVMTTVPAKTALFQLRKE